MNPRYLVFTVIALALVAGSAWSAEPKISNRAPKPDEWGYRPADGETVRMNPPSLTWVHEKEGVSYMVQIARDGDFDRGLTAGPLPFNVYTHNRVLPAGKYAWRYRLTDKKGRQSGWSLVRRFSIGPDAIAFPMPSRAEQQERVPRTHPRLFMRPEEVDGFRRAIREGGPAAQRFQKVKAEADRLLREKPTPEPTVRGAVRDPKTHDFWWPNRIQALRAGDECETLAFVYLLTQDPRYGRAARRFIMAYAAWDPDGPTNFKLNDEASFPLLYKLPRAYDWAYTALSESDRAKVRQVMLRRATDVWKSGQIGYGPGHLNRPYSSHANRAWHKLGECALAFYGELPQATDWLDYAVNKFYAAYPVWADTDGGWHEGASYSAGYMVKTVWWLQVAKNALGIDGFKKPYFSQVGDFFLYMAPPGSPNCGIGDLAFNPPRNWGGFLEFFCRAKNAPGEHGQYWNWWRQQWAMHNQDGILGVLYAATLPPLPEAKPPTDLPQSKVFHGIGQASLHSSLMSADQDVHFHFKSSPFGSQSHGHNAQNSFQLTAYGETLLPACTYRDIHGSPFHYRWVHSTFSQNAVLVDGQGQVMHQAAPLGRIVEERLTPAVDYVVGDATAAYAGRLERYRRHVAFVKPDLIVLYDELVAKEPATFQFMLHGLSPFKVDPAGNTLIEERPKASVTVRYLSPVGLDYRQTDGFDPKPTKDFPNLWHVEAGTREKRRELGMLTVLVPTRAGDQTTLSARRLESDTALGVRIERGGKTLVVAFRKAGFQGVAKIDGLTLDGPLLVQ